MPEISQGFFDTHYTDTSIPFAQRANEFFSDLGLYRLLFDYREYGDDLDCWNRHYLESLIRLLDEHIADNEHIADALKDLYRLRIDGDHGTLEDDPRCEVNSLLSISANALEDRVYEGLYDFFYIGTPELASSGAAEESLYRESKLSESEFLTAALESESCGLVEVSGLLLDAAKSTGEMANRLSSRLPSESWVADTITKLCQRFRVEYMRLASSKIRMLDAQGVPVRAEIITELIRGGLDAVGADLISRADALSTGGTR